MPTLRRSIAVLLLVAHVPACTSYRTTALNPHAAVVDQEQIMIELASAPDSSWGVTRGSDGRVIDDRRTETVLVKHPWVRTDSLRGEPCRLDRRDNRYRCAQGDTLTVPLSLVSQIKVKRVSAVKTTLLTAAVTAVVWLGIGIAVYVTHPIGGSTYVGP